MYTTKLGQELNIERKVIAFHPNALEEAELAQGVFGLSQDERPVAVKYYRLTPKDREIFERILHMLKNHH
jgi:predicted ArsR family transcriptional regulator